MSEAPGDDDYTAPHGDAGEPPRLIGVIGGMPVQGAHVIEAVLFNAYDKGRVACLLLANDMLARDPGADEFKAASLALHYERFLKDGVDNQLKKPSLSVVSDKAPA